MFDTLTPRSTTGEFETMPCARPNPGGFLLEARTGTREAAAHMKDLAERFAELRNAIINLPTTAPGSRHSKPHFGRRGASEPWRSDRTWRTR